MLFEKKTWKTWKNKNKHHTSPKPIVFWKFATKVLTSVVRDRHQVRQLAGWDAPHHPLGLSPKKGRKNNANGAVRSRAYGQRLWGAYNRLSQEAMVKPSSQSSPYTLLPYLRAIKIGPLLLLVTHFIHCTLLTFQLKFLSNRGDV